MYKMKDIKVPYPSVSYYHLMSVTEKRTPSA